MLIQALPLLAPPSGNTPPNCSLTTLPLNVTWRTHAGPRGGGQSLRGVLSGKSYTTVEITAAPPITYNFTASGQGNAGGVVESANVIITYVPLLPNIGGPIVLVRTAEPV